jgi:hypothetical protein
VSGEHERGNSARHPPVLIVGGFATMPPNYLPLQRRLLERGASRVDIAPLWFQDWFIAGLLGLGTVMRRTGRAIARTYQLGGRRPIIVVAHSGGGVAARLAMSQVPYRGHIAGVAPAVGCLVTLGTPHDLSQLSTRYRHAGHDAVEFLDREQPGAFYAPRTGYLSVAGTYPRADLPGFVGRAAHDFFSLILGDHTDELGDGIVPASVAHLGGAEHQSYDDVRHGVLGSHWYGDAEIVDRWWPAAVHLWVAAYEARHARVVAPNEPALAESGARP